MPAAAMAMIVSEEQDQCVDLADNANFPTAMKTL
jgi:hypothetical protein